MPQFDSLLRALGWNGKTCMYCDTPTPCGVAICEDCYRQREQDIINMECPDCSSENVRYSGDINMWYCMDCEEFFTWGWEILWDR